MVSATYCDDTPKMKNKSLFLTYLSAVTLVVGLVTGCATDNYHKGAGTASALTYSSQLITKGSSQIDDSLAALNDLVSNPQPDLTKQYDAFNLAVNNLGATAKDVADKTAAMKAQGAAYFAGWDNDIATMHNEDIRTRSEARRNEVAARFNRISLQYDQARIAFEPYMSDLRDVQKYLSTDLTSGGLAGIKGVAVKTTNDAEPLKSTLAKLSEQFKELGDSMAPTTASN
jgi:hypothetical protein